VTLVDSQPGDWNREKSQKVMEAFLVKYDDIDGVYSGDDNMGVGALNAAKAAGREGIIFVGATNFAVGYDAMERGEYWGSIYQSPVDDAEAALQTALDVLAGEDVPFLNYFDTPKITQDNMDEFDQAGLLIFLPGGGHRRPAPVFRISTSTRPTGRMCLGRWAELRGVSCIVTGAARALAAPSARPFSTKVRRSVSPTSTASRSPRWPRPTAATAGTSRDHGDLLRCRCDQTASRSANDRARRRGTSAGSTSCSTMPA
jgi:hypothetical protein